MQYAFQLLRSGTIPAKDSLILLRDYSVAIAGLEITRRKKTNAELLAEDLLKAFSERIDIDLNDDLLKGVIPRETDRGIMMDGNFGGKIRNLTKAQLKSKARSDAKRVKQNKPLLEADGLFNSKDCVVIYKRCKASALNSFNAALYSLLNKDKSIPSGKQLIEILNKIRELDFRMNDERRVRNLRLSRVRLVY
jgi:hypothetical protein